MKSKSINYWAKFEATGVYHVYNRGNNRENIFRSKENYRFFLQRFQELILPFFDVGAYCLMPNHFHFLLIVKSESLEIKAIIENQQTRRSTKYLLAEISYNDFLEDQFKRFFSSYSLAFNKQVGRCGSLFQKRFKRIRIDDRHRLLNLLAYIHHNPIHHKFSNRFDIWRFSSYNTFFKMETDSFIARNLVLKWFDDDLILAQKAFLEFHLKYQKNKTREAHYFYAELFA